LTLTLHEIPIRSPCASYLLFATDLLIVSVSLCPGCGCILGCSDIVWYLVLYYCLALYCYCIYSPYSLQWVLVISILPPTSACVCLCFYCRTDDLFVYYYL